MSRTGSLDYKCPHRKTVGTFIVGSLCSNPLKRPLRHLKRLDPSNIYPAGQKEGAIRTLRESIDCNFCNRIKSETNCADEDIYNYVYIINLVATSKK